MRKKLGRKALISLSHYGIKVIEMKVGIMSDTHDNLPNIERAIEVLKAEGVELVCHLGDHVSPFSLSKLRGLGCRVVAIYGNNDGDIATLKRVAEKGGIAIHKAPYEMEIDGKKALLLHGYNGKELTLKVVRSMAASGTYDIVMFGHIHECVKEFVGNCLVVNPGETFGMLTGKATVAVLDTREWDVRFLNL